MQNINIEKKLGVFSLVFFVVAAASPLTGFVGGVPIAMLLGNGAGVPGVYILSGIILLLFSVGFITMSRYVKNSGAFYAYISEGMGHKFGLSGLGVAVLTYIAIYLAVAAMFGLFAQLFFQEYLGMVQPWWLYTLVMLLVVCWLGIEKIEIGSRILGVLMILEIIIALIIAGASVNHAIETDTITFSSFSPSVIFHGNIGIALVFALASFIGFESTAIYSEECHQPEKTIPRATVIAVLLITFFFAFCSWGIIQTYGVVRIQDKVAADPELFVFNVAGLYFSKWITVAINLLLMTSLFAATQSFHNNISRYFYSLAKDGLYWKPLARLHPTKGTPYISGICGTLFMFICFSIVATLKLKPMIDVFTWGSTIATISILVLQIFVSIAVVKYFKDRPQLAQKKWKVLYIPSIAIISMSLVLIVILTNLQDISGISSNLVYLMPLVVMGTAISGYLYALIIKKFKPELFSVLDNLVAEV